MNCFGIDTLSGEGIEIEFGETIRDVRPADAPSDVYLAPGWVDIQVNGFAGVDYNLPGLPHSEIARSLGVVFAIVRLAPSAELSASSGRLELRTRSPRDCPLQFESK